MLRIGAQARDLVVDERLPVLRLRVREVGERLVERRLVRIRLAALHLHERVEVPRLRRLAVPDRCGHGHGAERRASGRRFEDALHDESLVRPVREGQLDRRAELQIVVVGEGVVDEHAVLSELGEDLLRPFLPIHVDHLRHARVGRGHELRLVVNERLAGADVSDRDDTRRLGGGLRSVDRDRREVVLRGDRVVAGEELVHCVRERAR